MVPSTLRADLAIASANTQQSHGSKYIVRTLCMKSVYMYIYNVLTCTCTYYANHLPAFMHIYMYMYNVHVSCTLYLWRHQLVLVQFQGHRSSSLLQWHQQWSAVACPVTRSQPPQPALCHQLLAGSLCSRREMGIFKCACYDMRYCITRCGQCATDLQ